MSRRGCFQRRRLRLKANLAQREAPCVVLELVLDRSQLRELWEVWKGLQPADDLLQLLLLLNDEEVQQTEHLQQSHNTESTQTPIIPSALPPRGCGITSPPGSLFCWI